MAPNRLAQCSMYTLLTAVFLFLACISVYFPGPERAGFFQTDLAANTTALDFGIGTKVAIPFGRHNDLFYLESVNGTAGSRLGQGLESSLEKRETNW